MSYHSQAYKNVPVHFIDRLFYKRYWEGTEGKILDVGCSVGHQLRVGRNKVGVDIDPEAIEEAVALGHEAYLIKDVFPFGDESFSGVECRDVIEHTDARKLLSEIHRVLQPGGRLIIETPDIKYAKWSFWDNYEHVSPFTKKSLGDLLTDSGFKILESSYVYRGIWGSKTLNKWGLLSENVALKIQDWMRLIYPKREQLRIIARKGRVK